MRGRFEHTDALYHRL